MKSSHKLALKNPNSKRRQVDQVYSEQIICRLGYFKAIRPFNNRIKLTADFYQVIQCFTECFWDAKLPELNKKQIYVKTAEQKF